MNDTVKNIKQPGEPAKKPELDVAMAAWLVTKLDCPITLENHQERTNFHLVIQKLSEIAAWKAPE